MTSSAAVISYSGNASRIRRRGNTAKIVSLALSTIEDDVNDFDLVIPTLSFKNKTDSGEDSSSSAPFDQVTVTTCSSDDDSGSVSSLSTGEDDESSTRSAHRAIFNCYWHKNGGAPSLKHAPISSLVFRPDIIREDSFDSANTYERTLKVKEVSSPSSPSQRRKIFGKGCWSQSEPNLTMATKDLYMRRSTKSTSALHVKPQSSCLRKGRFSTSSAPPSPSAGSDNTSVSFSKDVNVRVFQKTCENWAQDGWSKHFTS